MTTLDVLNVGTPVSLIGFVNGDPQSAIGTVCSESPLIVESNEVASTWATVDQTIKVLFQNSGSFETAEAKIQSASVFGGKLRLELENVEWQKSNRRAFERYKIKVLTKCRLVSEESNGLSIREFTVTTNDISLGGAWVQSDAAVSSGSILNCELSLSPTSSAKILAVVAWADPNGKGFGVEFLDFVGTSRSELQAFISKLAA